MLNTQVNGFAVSDGVNNSNLRQGRMMDLIVSELQGRYYEQAARGNLFTANTSGVGVTLATANALGSATPAAGAAQPILGLINPQNSGVNLAIQRTKIQTLSGLPGGGFVFGFISGQAALYTGGRGLGIAANTLTSGGKAAVNANSALVGTTFTMLELRMIGGPAAITAGAGLYCVDEETAGDVIVPDRKSTL